MQVSPQTLTFAALSYRIGSWGPARWPLRLFYPWLQAQARTVLLGAHFQPGPHGAYGWVVLSVLTELPTVNGLYHYTLVTSQGPLMAADGCALPSPGLQFICFVPPKFMEDTQPELAACCQGGLQSLGGHPGSPALGPRVSQSAWDLTGSFIPGYRHRPKWHPRRRPELSASCEVTIFKNNLTESASIGSGSRC